MTWRADEAAIEVDTYLDELLAVRARHLAPAAEGPAELDRTARLVREALVRFHPSFRFEEELAARLRGVATGAARASSLVRFPAAGALLAPAGVTPLGAGGVASAGTRTVPTDAASIGGNATQGVVPGAAATPDLLGGQDARDHGRVRIGGVIASGVSLASGLSLAAGMLLARRRRGGSWDRLA